jgi:hypothetical protein
MGRESEWIFPNDPEEKCPKLRDALAAAKAERDDLVTELHRVNSLCNGLRKERDEAINTLKRISEWGCNGQCVELVGTQCPCCMAASFLERMEVKP